MPYIQTVARAAIDAGHIPANAGELNYAISRLVLTYVDANGGTTYQHVNDVMGALEGAKQEFYRRLVGPYEDSKIKQNGDIY